MNCSCMLVPQAQHESVLRQQSAMDEVSGLAQALLEVNSDARVSHIITQLSTKYQTLASTSKVTHRPISLYSMDR